jgi:UDP-MurNAc hydroxylase
MNVEYRDVSLLVDPWLIGSCYWRSWWNYPPLPRIDFDELNPQFIYITHVHWDHWHGSTLRKFLDKEVTLITHNEPNKRSYRDLLEMGFKDVVLLHHKETMNLGEVSITPYQFGLFLNDSALVIETPEYSILNANDCKIAGASLEHLKSRHGDFDFALRSHSSANDRVCYEVKGMEERMDDPSHYSRSFKLFMDNVGATYAVPFASNHCHLHKETLPFNSMVNNPFRLAEDLERMGGLETSELKIMLPGDSWSPQSGFSIDSSKRRFFDDLETCVLEYQEEKSEILEAYYQQEDRAALRPRTIEAFKKQLNYIPKWFLRNLKGWKVGFVLGNEKKSHYLVVDPYHREVNLSTKEEVDSLGSKIYMPSLVFRDAIDKQMFHHSGISKRNRYVFENEEELRKWETFSSLFEKVEFEVFPLSFKYLKSLFFSYLRRRHELLVYLKAFLLLKKGYRNYEIEEIILEEGK